MKVYRVFYASNQNFNFTVHHRIINLKICSTIRTNRQIVLNNLKKSMKFLVEINIGFKSSPKILEVYWHPYETDFFISKYKPTILGFRNRVFIFSHRNIMTNSLAYPYKTNCINYGTLGFKSREHFLNECFLRKSLKKYNSSCCGVPLSLDSKIKIKYFEHLKGFDSIIDECNSEHASQDCHLINSISTLQAYTPLNHTWMTLTELRENIVINITSLLDLTNYLIYIATVLCCWIGVDFNSIYDFVNYGMIMSSFSKFCAIKQYFERYFKFNRNIPNLYRRPDDREPGFLFIKSKRIFSITNNIV